MKKKKVDARKAKADIAEERSHLIANKRYYQHVLETHVDRMAEANDAIQKAEAAKAKIESEFEQAPFSLQAIDKKLALLAKRENTVVKKPKLEQLKKLKDQIRALEADLSE
jgi:hypothetical protein